MNKLGKYIAESLLNELQEEVTVLFPGGFKPPHGGHLELALRYASEPNVKQVKILIGPATRDGITRDQSVQVWKALLQEKGDIANKISVEQIEVNSPITSAYKYLETAEPGTYALASSSKGEDYQRVVKFVEDHSENGRYNREGINVIALPIDSNPIPYKNRSPKASKYAPGKSENGKGISASVLRADLANQDVQAMATNYPNVTNATTLLNVYRILTGKSVDISELPTLNEGKLRIFDFDDTLVHTNSKIHVIKKITGDKITMNAAQYALYEPDEGDVLDFSEFDGPIKSAKEFTKYTNVMRSMLRADGTDRKVVVLTARSDGKSVQDYLKTIGIDVPVVAVASSDPYKKSQWIEDQIAQGYDDVYFIDDSPKNIAAVNALKTKYPQVKIRTQNALKPDLPAQNMNELIDKAKALALALKIKAKFKDFLAKIKQEGEETKQAFVTLVNAVKNQKELNPEEREQIGDQMKDVLKTLGLTAATLLPGGTLYFILVKLLKLEKYTMPSSFIAEKTQLNEGGAAGHLAHPYEDLDLTFGEVKDMIKAALGGTLEYAQEKLDGQNLMVTYKDGKVRAARNKGQIKNFGQNSLTTDQLSQMFAGRGAIQTAFVETMNDLETAINKLSPKEKADFFQNGKRFISLEVLFPETSNVVPYGASQLRLHHFKEYDQEGNITEEDVEGIYKLQQAFDTVQANQQKTFMIRTTDPAKLKADNDYEAQLRAFTDEVKGVQSRYTLNDKNKVSDYVSRWWSDLIKQNAKTLRYKLPQEVLDLLIKRWAFTDKSTKITDIKKLIANEQFRAWVEEFDKGQVESNKKIALKPIETLFLKLGVRILRNIENLTTLNPDSAKRSIKQDLSAAIRNIQNAADTETLEDNDAAIRFLKRELTRLKDIGGFEAIVPTEGLVFKYKGKLYKLTGAFAPINQILGYLRF